MTRKLSITYSSWPLRWTSGMDELATLAVFYDEIWLPELLLRLPAELEQWQTSRRKLAEAAMAVASPVFSRWRDHYNPLFEEGILRFVPPQTSTVGDTPRDVPPPERNRILEKVARAFEPVSDLMSDLQEGGLPDRILDATVGTISFGRHVIFGSNPAPELFLSGSSATDTGRLAGFLLRSLFQYQIPLLSNLHADQVLEVREYLADTKEGFADYLFELTDDVESRILDGGLTEAEAAQRTVERKLLPQYHEFRRQLEAKDTGFWSKVLAKGAKLLQIDAAPWTPKFYGALLEAVFGSLDVAAEFDEEDFSNKRQAFQHLARIEKAVDR